MMETAKEMEVGIYMLDLNSFRCSGQISRSRNIVTLSLCMALLFWNPDSVPHMSSSQLGFFFFLCCCVLIPILKANCF
jgi:hypothetical protein